MRILHTSDWHLGRSFHGVPLLDGQLRAIDAMVELVRAEAIDVVVLAGDIYDRAIPAADAVQGFSYALAELRGAGATVVGISGNHDSAIRVGFAESVLSAGGVTLRGDIARAGEAVLVSTHDGESAVAFYPIPYLEPETARHALASPETRSHDALLRIALDRARHNHVTHGSMRSVAIVHTFVTGGQECDSELALAVGGSAEVALRHLDGFDYVALGHLHGRQSLAGGRAQYSGSLLAYSFSEKGHTKGGWIVDLPADGGPVRSEAFDVPVPKALHVVRGELAELLADRSHSAAEHGFVQAILTDPVLPAEAMARLRRRFPHAVLLGHEPPTILKSVNSYAERVRGRNDLDLASDFIEHVTGVAPTSSERADLIAAINGTSQPGNDDRAVA